MDRPQGVDTDSFRKDGITGRRFVDQSSDEKLEEAIKEILSHSERIDSDHILVQVDNRNVTLSGMIGDADQKAEVERMVFMIEGVGEVRNELGLEYGPLS